MVTRRETLIGMGGLAILGSVGCTAQRLPEAIEIHDPAGEALFSGSSGLEQLAEGFSWSEGPTWDRVRDCLYVSDVPGNTAFMWSEDGGLETFLDPSGTDWTNAEGIDSPGTNGLWYGADDRLYLCNHGTRSVQRMCPGEDARETLVDRFEGQRFNSPNDLVRASDGTLYFTDPPYGLEGLNGSPLKEMDVNGVYRLSPDGMCERLFDQLTFPNGVALSPDERSLYVTQSDPDAPHLYRAALGADGSVGALERMYDMADFLAAGDPGLPDGLAVSTQGVIFTTGPGGVLVISPEGRLLARILTGRATANCAFGGQDGRTLYMTAHDRLLRIATNATGVQWVP